MYSSKKFSPTSTTASSGPKTLAFPTAAFTDIRTKVLQRYGKIGLKAVGQLLRSLDTDNKGSLEAGELRTGLREGLGVCIADTDFTAIAAALDVDGSGRIDLKEIITALRGAISNRRKNAIEQAFRRLDVDGTGYVELRHLMNSYEVSRHPDYVAKRASGDELRSKFYKDFSEQEHPDGLVSVEEFVNYYVGVSDTRVIADDQFELLMIRSWGLDRPNNASAALAASREGSRTGQDGVSSRYNANHGVPPLPRHTEEELNASASRGSVNNRIGVITEDGAIARREHPLYQTAMMEYGKTASQHTHEPKHHRPGGFTKNAPPFSAGSGLNTATTRSRV